MTKKEEKRVYLNKEENQITIDFQAKSRKCDCWLGNDTCKCEE